MYVHMYVCYLFFIFFLLLLSQKLAYQMVFYKNVKYIRYSVNNYFFQIAS